MMRRFVMAVCLWGLCMPFLVFATDTRADIHARVGDRYFSPGDMFGVLLEFIIGNPLMLLVCIGVVVFGLSLLLFRVSDPEGDEEPPEAVKKDTPPSAPKKKPAKKEKTSAPSTTKKKTTAKKTTKKSAATKDKDTDTKPKKRGRPPKKKPGSKDS